jgi:hypothetical protein
MRKTFKKHYHFVEAPGGFVHVKGDFTFDFTHGDCLKLIAHPR